MLTRFWCMACETCGGWLEMFKLKPKMAWSLGPDRKTCAHTHTHKRIEKTVRSSSSSYLWLLGTIRSFCQTIRAVLFLRASWSCANLTGPSNRLWHLSFVRPKCSARMKKLESLESKLDLRFQVFGENAWGELVRRIHTLWSLIQPFTDPCRALYSSLRDPM